MRWAIGWRFQGVVLLVLVVACIKVSGGEARKLASCRLQVGAPPAAQAALLAVA